MSRANWPEDKQSGYRNLGPAVKRSIYIKAYKIQGWQWQTEDCNNVLNVVYINENTLIDKDRLGGWSPETDYFLQLTFWKSGGSNLKNQVTLKIASALVVKALVPNNSPSQDSYRQDDIFLSGYVDPAFKPFFLLT